MRNSTGWTRRQFVSAAAGALVLPRLAVAEGPALPAATLAALDRSSLVYISPLLESGAESTCHGEVWFMHDAGDVLLVTSSTSWKTRAVQRGLDRARIWVGDFGVIRKARPHLATAPKFDARVSIDADPAPFARLLRAFAIKYPDEWGKWKPRFEKGMADGSRVLLRYTPTT